MDINKCLICGEGVEITPVIRHPSYRINKCRKCGLIYQEQSQRFSYVNYDNIYQNTPNYQRANRSQRKMFDGIHSEINKYGRTGRTVLEVGCSYGLLLAYLREKGWETTGIDMCRKATEYAQVRGLNCYNTSIEDFRPSNKFEIILLIHVLEHLKKPLQSLQEIQSWLIPGGILYIRVPNIESSILRWSKANFLGHLKPFEHLYYFSPTTIKRLLEKAGYMCSIKLAGRNTLGDIINNKLRSKLVLNKQWLSLNYERVPEKKKSYSILKLVYEKIILRLLDFIPVGPLDKEIIISAWNRG